VQLIRKNLASNPAHRRPDHAIWFLDVHGTSHAPIKWVPKTGPL